MSIKHYIGQELIANENENRLYVRLENDDLVDVSKLVEDIDFSDYKEVRQTAKVVIRSQVTIS